MENEGGNLRLFVKEDNICTSLEKGMRSGETGETTTDNDDANHCEQKTRGRDGSSREEEKELAQG